MPLPKELARSETQTASFMVWTRITDSISYSDKRNAKFTYFNKCSLHKERMTRTLSVRKLNKMQIFGS